MGVDGRHIPRPEEGERASSGNRCNRPSGTCNANCREIVDLRCRKRRDPTAKEAGMRTAVRVRLGALVAGAALGGLALAGQASAAPSYGPVYSPTPITVNVPGFISITGGGGPVDFGSVTPGSPVVKSGPLAQVIQTNNPFGYNFTADWTGFTGPTAGGPRSEEHTS